MKKKKILYVITKSSGGGAQRYVYDLATNLPADSWDVAVAVGGNGPLVSKLHGEGIRTIEVKSFVRDVALLRDFRTLRELITLFRNETPDVVHLNSAKAVGLGAIAARLAGVPRIIATVHGSAAQESWRPWWQRVLIRIIEHISRMLAHETIVVSARDQKSGTTLIHNGVADTTFKSREEARRELGIPQEVCVVGTIGEQTQNKNQRVLIESVGALSSSNAILAIIGDGEMRAALESAARAYPSHDIRFLGFKENAAQYLHAFDIFVLPSLKEGLPYVLLEAGQAKLPVIATHVGGIPEIIEHTKTGLLVEPDNTSALCDALTLLIQDELLRTECGTALKEKVAHEFSLERMVAQTLALY